MSEMVEFELPKPLVIEVEVPGKQGVDGEPGEPGPPGASITSGEGAPESTGEVPGTVYINTSNGDLWQTEDGDNWALRVNLKGPPGPETLSDFATYDPGNSPADGSYLRWDATTGKWIATWDADRAKFKGDWQDPADSLLFSANFEDSSNSAKFDHWGDNMAVVESPTLGGAAPSYPKSLRLSYPSTVESYTELVLVSAGLNDKYITYIEFDWAVHIRTGVLGSGYKAAFDVGSDRKIEYSNASSGPTIIPWETVQYAVMSGSPTLRWKGSGDGTDRSTYIYLTGVKIYGANSPTLLYQKNDVVYHQGKYYRSLFDANSQEPSTGENWLEIGDL